MVKLTELSVFSSKQARTGRTSVVALMRSKSLVTAIMCLLSVTLISTRAVAEDWIRFRGPRGTGTSPQTGLPETWSSTTNLVWRTELPGAGASSPIVIGGKIFLTCYSGYGTGVDRRTRGRVEDLRRCVVCLSRDNGRIIWNRQVPGTVRAHGGSGRVPLHGYASSTPTTDGQKVYCFFGNSGVYAFSLDGEPKWHTRVGDGTHSWGSATSPVIYKTLVIVNASLESGELVALRKEDGSVAWKAPGITKRESWNTPVLVQVRGREELVVSAGSKTMGFDPETGKPLWQCNNEVRGYVCPSVVAHDGVVYSMGGSVVVAIRAGGRGDVTDTHRVWTLWKGSGVSSPVYHDGHLYWIKTKGGVVCCVSTDSGKLVYQERLDSDPGVVYASPVVADGKLYCMSRENGAFVVAAEPRFQLLAHNTFADDRSIFNASPAVVEGQLILRSNRCLYCIGTK